MIFIGFGTTPLWAKILPTTNPRPLTDLFHPAASLWFCGLLGPSSGFPQKSQTPFSGPGPLSRMWECALNPPTAAGEREGTRPHGCRHSAMIRTWRRPGCKFLNKFWMGRVFRPVYYFFKEQWNWLLSKGWRKGARWLSEIRSLTPAAQMTSSPICLPLGELLVPTSGQSCTRVVSLWKETATIRTNFMSSHHTIHRLWDSLPKASVKESVTFQKPQKKKNLIYFLVLAG